MLILMHKPGFIKIIFAAAMLVSTGKVAAQAEELEQAGRLINDALFYSDQYITPATDGAIYQAASGWMATAKERKRWDVTLALHTNIFVIPNSDRNFTINNSDFEFFTLTEGTSATVPTALGGREKVRLTGQLGDNEVSLTTPEGMNRESIIYPYLQGAVGIGWGTEVVVKYSPKVKIKRSDYQVYGFGLKHNISRYFNALTANNINLSVLAAYSKEDVSFAFLNVSTSAGTLGINSLNGLVDTWQFQANASKEWGGLEVMAGFIVNTSDVEYRVGGEKGTIEAIVPLQDILNKRLEEIYKTRTNCIGEASIKYNISNFSIQSILAFGKFVNTNLSIQYLFQ